MWRQKYCNRIRQRDVLQELSIRVFWLRRDWILNWTDVVIFVKFLIFCIKTIITMLHCNIHLFANLCSNFCEKNTLGQNYSLNAKFRNGSESFKKIGQKLFKDIDSISKASRNVFQCESFGILRELTKETCIVSCMSIQRILIMYSEKMLSF